MGARSGGPRGRVVRCSSNLLQRLRMARHGMASPHACTRRRQGRACECWSSQAPASVGPAAVGHASPLVRVTVERWDGPLDGACAAGEWIHGVTCGRQIIDCASGEVSRLTVDLASRASIWPAQDAQLVLEVRGRTMPSRPHANTCAASARTCWTHKRMGLLIVLLPTCTHPRTHAWPTSPSKKAATQGWMNGQSAG